MGKYTELLSTLDQSISLDQVYVVRDTLAELDPVLNRDKEVSAYYAENAAKLDKVRGEIVYLDELLEELNTDVGWKKSVEQKDGTRVFFKKEEGSPFVMTKLEALLPCETPELARQFIRLLSLFNESDLMPKWFPMGLMKSNETLVSPTPFTKVNHITIKLPFPVSQVFGPRDCIIEGKGYDLSERKAAAISLAPLEIGTNVHGIEVEAPANGYTRFILKGAFYFEMTREGIMFKQTQLMDLKSKLIPTPIMNWLSKGEQPLKFLSKIRSRMAKFEGSEWEERVLADTVLYNDVQARLAAAVKREFGVEAVSLKDKAGKMQKSKSKRRLPSLRKKREEVVHAVEEIEEEIVDVVLDTRTAVIASMKRMAKLMWEQCTASIGQRQAPPQA